MPCLLESCWEYRLEGFVSCSQVVSKVVTCPEAGSLHLLWRYWCQSGLPLSTRDGENPLGREPGSGNFHCELKASLHNTSATRLLEPCSPFLGPPTILGSLTSLTVLTMLHVGWWWALLTVIPYGRHMYSSFIHLFIHSSNISWVPLYRSCLYTLEIWRHS